MGARSRPGKGSSGKAAATAATATKTVPPAPLAPKSLWAKAFDSAEELTPQEALTAAHWLRQASGLLMGSVFGVLQLTGAPAILTFLLVATLFPAALLSLTNELDPEEIAKISPIQTEGLMPAFALFLLSWILSYTVFLPPSS